MIGGMLAELLIVLGICVVLPIVLALIIARTRTNATNKRTEIALAAIEKGSVVDLIDLEEFFKKMNPKGKTIKEKLLLRLLCGCIFTFFAVFIYIALAVQFFFEQFHSGMFVSLSFVAVPSLGIGIAFLVNYFVGKKTLKEEMEAELKNLQNEE